MVTFGIAYHHLHCCRLIENWVTSWNWDLARAPSLWKILIRGRGGEEHIDIPVSVTPYERSHVYSDSWSRGQLKGLLVHSVRFQPNIYVPSESDWVGLGLHYPCLNEAILPRKRTKIRNEITVIKIECSLQWRPKFSITAMNTEELISQRLWQQLLRNTDQVFWPILGVLENGMFFQIFLNQSHAPS